MWTNSTLCSADGEMRVSSHFYETSICAVSDLAAQRPLPHSAINGQAKQRGLELLWKLRQAEATQDIMKHVWLSREGKRWLN